MKFKILICLLCLPLFSHMAVAEKINLQDELTPELNNQQGEVHAYSGDNGARVTEYRSGGRVWMIKVQPAGNFPAYYLYDEVGDGTFKRRIMGIEQPQAPMWIIKKF